MKTVMKRVAIDSMQVLTLINRLEHLILGKPQVPHDRPFDVDQVLWRANLIFVEHNVSTNVRVLTSTWRHPL